MIRRVEGEVCCFCSDQLISCDQLICCQFVHKSEETNRSREKSLSAVWRCCIERKASFHNIQSQVGCVVRWWISAAWILDPAVSAGSHWACSGLMSWILVLNPVSVGFYWTLLLIFMFLKVIRKGLDCFGTKAHESGRHLKPAVRDRSFILTSQQQNTNETTRNQSSMKNTLT